MGSNFHGTVKWRCHSDCVQTGCPGHEASLQSKHGAYFLRYPDGRQGEVHPEIGLINAVSWTLWHKRGLVEENS